MSKVLNVIEKETLEDNDIPGVYDDEDKKYTCIPKTEARCR